MALSLTGAEQLAECFAVLVSESGGFNLLVFVRSQILPHPFELGSALETLSLGLFRLSFLLLLNDRLLSISLSLLMQDLFHIRWPLRL